MSWRTCRWGILMACAIVHGRWRNGGAIRLGTVFHPKLLFLQIERCCYPPPCNVSLHHAFFFNVLLSPNLSDRTSHTMRSRG